MTNFPSTTLTRDSENGKLNRETEQSTRGWPAHRHATSIPVDLTHSFFCSRRNAGRRNLRRSGPIPDAVSPPPYTHLARDVEASFLRDACWEMATGADAWKTGDVFPIVRGCRCEAPSPGKIQRLGGVSMRAGNARIMRPLSSRARKILTVSDMKFRTESLSFHLQKSECLLDSPVTFSVQPIASPKKQPGD